MGDNDIAEFFAALGPVVELTFAAEGSATRMNLRRSGFSSSDMRDGYRGGWNATGGAFDKLGGLLESKGTTTAVPHG